MKIFFLSGQSFYEVIDQLEQKKTVGNVLPTLFH